MDLTQVGIALAVVGCGLNLAVVLPMKPATKKIVGRTGIVLVVLGLGMLGYGFLSGSGLGDMGTPAAITQDHPVNSPNFINPQTSQTMTNSPGGVQALGDNITVSQGLQSRKLTPAQEERFVQVLKDKSKGHVAITCIESGGPEPCNFARQLQRLLESKDAGWTVSFDPMMLGAGDPTKPIPALYLEAQSEAPPPFAFALREALKAALGHDPVCLVKADQPPDFLQLTVWHNRQ